MRSKHNSTRQCPRATARLQVLFFHSRKAGFLACLVIVAIFYQSALKESSSSSHSPSTKRSGVGGRDASVELSSLLQRRQDGRAAVAIIRVIEGNDNDAVKYLVQLKSHNYPISEFRGSVCLLGGNANINDATPLDTLKRELNEELQHPVWVNSIDVDQVIDETSHRYHQLESSSNITSVPLIPGTVRFLGLTIHTQSARIVQKSHSYSFLCALYEITLHPNQLPPSVLYPRGANVQEGRLALLTQDQLVQHAKYAWGYEYTMKEYFGKNITHVCEGVSVHELEGDMAFEQIDWTPQKKR